MPSEFGAKILSGAETSPEEWQQHLREVHARLPGVTASAFAGHATRQGQTSYQLLADVAVGAARRLGRAVDVLDLACGDGYLIEVCLDRLGRDLNTVTGVDMSEAELDAARRRLAGQAARVELGFAHALPLPDAAVDVVVCHLAFMLMVPIEPVVRELARVLRPGGVFGAVVGSSSAPPGASDEDELAAERALWTEIGETLRRFWRTEYPQLQSDGRVGDVRTMTEDGWRELFQPDTGYTGVVEPQEFELVIDESAEGIWDFFKNTYLIDLLDAEAKEALRSRLMAVIADHDRTHGMHALAFPVRVFSVWKA